MVSNNKILTGVVYDSTHFRFDRSTGTFHAEVAAVPGVLRELWSDSMDLGFGIRSRKSDLIAYYVLMQVAGPEDSKRFIFGPTEETRRSIPATIDTQVHIHHGRA